MLSFPIALARLTVRRTPRRLLREAGIGACVGALLGTGVSLSAPWTFLVVLFYLYIVQVVWSCNWIRQSAHRVIVIKNF